MILKLKNKLLLLFKEKGAHLSHLRSLNFKLSVNLLCLTILISNQLKCKLDIVKLIPMILFISIFTIVKYPNFCYELVLRLDSNRL